MALYKFRIIIIVIIIIDKELFRERSGTLWNFTFGEKVPELYATLQ